MKIGADFSKSIFCGVLMLLFARGNALKCYECESTKKPDCGLSFRESSFEPKECPDETTSCALQRQKVSVDPTVSVTGILRGCYSPNMVRGLNSSNGCRHFTIPDRKGNFTALFCFCDTDMCNTSQTAHVASSMLIGSALCLCLLWRLVNSEES